MQEAPNSYEKDEQQERGNYDSADYMEKSHGWQGSSLGFESHILRF